MLTQGMDMAQASLASGISTDPKLGEGEGLIGVLRHPTPSHPYHIAYTSTGVRRHADLARTPFTAASAVRLAPHLPLMPGVLSRGRVRRLEYTVGAITNALFFVENEGWY